MVMLNSHARRLPRALVLAAGLSAIGPAAHAQNLFVIGGTSNGAPIEPVGADNLIDLVTEAVNNEDRFSGLVDTEASLSLNYGGIVDAIKIDKNAANTFATLSFVNADGTRTTREFDTASPDANGRSLETLVEDYLKKEGTKDLKSFFQAVNAQSVIAVSDGNPNATTARMAGYSFDRFGRSNRQTAMWVMSKPEGENAAAAAERAGASLQFRIGANASVFEVGDFDGESATVSSSLDWNFSPRVGVSLGSFFAYNAIGEADVFHAGFNLGVPVRVVLPTPELPLTWQLAPSFTFGGSASEDVGAGGLIYGGALTSLLRWDINDRWAVEMANQIGFYEGQTLTFDDYEIDPGVSQQILKNGVEAQYRFSEAWYAFGGAAYTNFLDDAAVEAWLSPTVGIGWRKASMRGTSFEAGFVGDYGDDYSASGGRLSLNIAF
jgi:hypothetical protein